MDINIDNHIKEIWLEKIMNQNELDDYYKKDSLKISLHKYLFEQFEFDGLLHQGYRVFKDYRLPCGRIVDIAILKVTNELVNDFPLTSPIIFLEGIIEIELSKEPQQFLSTLKDFYTTYYPKVHLYTVFTDNHGKRLCWLLGDEHNELPELT